MLAYELAYEFWESGIENLRGENWFADAQDKFPFPFSLVRPDVSWFIATWAEALGAIGLVLGTLTRFFSLALIVLTIIARVSVHAGNG